jgi:Pyruvate phosphate dikinase, AMP/ATP-binding domain
MHPERSSAAATALPVSRVSASRMPIGTPAWAKVSLRLALHRRASRSPAAQSRHGGRCWLRSAATGPAASSAAGVRKPPATSKVSRPGGLVSSPGVCSILARRKRRRSNGMDTKEHAAVVAGGDRKGIDTFRPDCYDLSLQEIDETQVAVVGGKGAHLGELSRIEGIRVPPGFCVTTDAFRRIVGEADHPRTRRLHPVVPGRGSRRGAASRRTSPDRDRSGHRH